jgi:NAD+ synthase (glutamine-hydrolysing)
MRLVRIALASVNAKVGAVHANTTRAVSLARALAEEGVTVAVFPEQVLGGYAPEDLVQWQRFVESQWTALERFTAETADTRTVYALGVTVAHEGLRFNCAAVVAGGRIRGLVPKEKLPTYNVFYEGRTFAPGAPGMAVQHRGVPLGDLIFEFDFGVLGAEVCEDLWSPEGPLRRRTFAGAELVVNLSASPFRVGVQGSRRELVSQRAADCQATLAYANLVGANDGLIFDGGGFVNQGGKMVLEAPRFREGYATAVVDLDRTLRLRGEATTWRNDRVEALSRGTPVTRVTVGDFRTERSGLCYPVPAHRSFFLPPPEARAPGGARGAFCEEILDALALGVGDYFEKTGGFRCIGVALSGGRDSLLTLLVAHRYAQRARPEAPGSLLRAFYMPSRYSSEQTRAASETLCLELGVPLEVVDIDDAFQRELAVTKQMLAGAEVTALTEQNIQARLRGQRMWNWSNSAGGLFLQTGNMSERAVGYTTVGGDLEGALSVIANLPKTVVNHLLGYLQEQTGLDGIRRVLERPAGPELAPNQSGEAELMPFPVLDACFFLFAAEKLSPDEVKEVIAQMFPELGAETAAAHVEKFTRLFTRSIFKWVQAPLTLHVGNLDLDRERALQLPVVMGNEWMDG